MERRSSVYIRRRRIIGQLLIVALLCYASLNLLRLLGQEWRLLNQLRIFWHEQQAVDAKHAQLQARIIEARSEHGSEHLARKSLALVRPGEIPVVFLTGARSQVIRYPAPPTPAPTSTPP
ncbi:MAG: hypothetical protein HY692_08880 [Cyanobacteria bacterium NC_groundwater_1444_Ag_S-0.65um_54_12]|nr:hypothetical protein [Cyanobacteria bacterium NC_groundwater_1444_Ag_S-0.65um_54_12]